MSYVTKVQKSVNLIFVCNQMKYWSPLLKIPYTCHSGSKKSHIDRGIFLYTVMCMHFHFNFCIALSCDKGDNYYFTNFKFNFRFRILISFGKWISVLIPQSIWLSVNYLRRQVSGRGVKNI